MSQFTQTTKKLLTLLIALSLLVACQHGGLTAPIDEPTDSNEGVMAGSSDSEESWTLNTYIKVPKEADSAFIVVSRQDTIIVKRIDKTSPLLSLGHFENNDTGVLPQDKIIYDVKFYQNGEVYSIALDTIVATENQQMTVIKTDQKPSFKVIQDSITANQNVKITELLQVKDNDPFTVKVEWKIISEEEWLGKGDMITLSKGLYEILVRLTDAYGQVVEQTFFLEIIALPSSSSEQSSSSETEESSSSEIEESSSSETDPVSSSSEVEESSSSEVDPVSSSSEIEESSSSVEESSSSEDVLTPANINLTVVCVPECGGLDALGNFSIGGPVVEAGEASATVTVTPNEGVFVSQWEVEVAGSGVVTPAVDMLSADVEILEKDVTIKVYFEKHKYTITTSAVNGQIQISRLVEGEYELSDGTDIEWGEEVQIQAIPNSGYAFTQWSISKSNIELADFETATTTLVVKGNGTVNAGFEATKVDPIIIKAK